MIKLFLVVYHTIYGENSLFFEVNGKMTLPITELLNKQLKQKEQAPSVTITSVQLIDTYEKGEKQNEEVPNK